MLVSSMNYFRDSGIESLVVGQGTDHPYADEMSAKGCLVAKIRSTRTFRGIKDLRKIVRDWSPDIVHIHTESAFALSVLGSHFFRSNPRIVRTVHSIFDHSGRDDLSRRTQAFLVDRFVSAFIAPSPDVATIEERYFRDCKVIYNWVDDRFFKLRRDREDRGGGDEIRKSIVLVGNCSAVKNHEVVLSAMKDLDYDLYFHGDEGGASERELYLLNSLESEGRIIHRGKGDPGPSLVNGTLFAVSSLKEGMSVALAEALTVGMPCLVNDVPGLQWARDWDNVRMVENSLPAWIDALANWEQIRIDSTTTGKSINFSATRGTEEYVHLYHQVSGAVESSV